MSDLYGPIIGADDVMRTVRDHLVAWSESYVAEVARQAGMNAADLPPFQTFRARSQLQTADELLQPGMQLPACLVECDGITTIDSDDYDIAANVIVRVYASANNDQDTMLLVSLYAKAVRAAIVQHPTLGELAFYTRWDSSAFAEPVTNERAEAMTSGAAVLFSVHIADAVDRHAGPDELPVNPLGTPPLVPTVGDPPDITIIVDHIENLE